MAGKAITQKNIGKLIISSEDSRELCFLLIYSVCELEAFSNLAAKAISRVPKKDTISPDFVRAMFYGTITYAYSIDFLIKHIAKSDVEKMDGVIRSIVRMSVWQFVFSSKVPEFAAVFQAVELTRKYSPQACAYVNAILRKITNTPVDKFNLSQYKAEIECSLKPEIYGVFKKSYGKDRALSIGRALLEVNGFSIRYNTSKISQDALIRELEQEGIFSSSGYFMNEALHINECEMEIDKSKSFEDGSIFVQSEAAMLASRIANPKSKDRILDICSAPGGKTTHIAQIVADDCQIDALDINESRLELVKQNIERLKLNSISCSIADATTLGTNPDFEAKLSSYDIVLADVPCSGLGLLARKPDIRRTITYDRIVELLEKQRVILDNASKFVKPGGSLIYCTCTLNVDKNENQVKAFLDRNPYFYTESIEQYLPERLIINSDREVCIKNGYITLFPDVDNSDGFFICRMIKRLE